MANEQLPDFNIFRTGMSSFSGIIDNFLSFFELAAPLSEKDSGGIGLFTIPLYEDKGSHLLPAFTDSRLLRQPFVARAPLEFLKLFFHSQTADFFSFNSSTCASGNAPPKLVGGNLSRSFGGPAEHNTSKAPEKDSGPGPKGRDAGAEVRLDRQQLSLLIGAIETLAGPTSGTLPQGYLLPMEPYAAEIALAQARTHSAHYLASLAPAGPQTDFIKASALAELDLYQEAYDLLKGDKSPRAICLLAEIHRRTGNQRNARELLGSIPPNAGQDRKKNLETAWLELEEGKFIEAQRMFRTMADGGNDRQEALFGLAMAAAGTVSETENPTGLNEAAVAFEAALENPSKMSARIFFYAGNFFLRCGRTAHAEACYRESARFSPSIQVRANLALTLLKEHKLEEAAAITAEIAFTEPASAGRLINQFPKDKVIGLFKNAFLSLLKAKPEPVVADNARPDDNAGGHRHASVRGPRLPKTDSVTPPPISEPATPATPSPSSNPLFEAGDGAKDGQVRERPATGSGVPEETTVSLEPAAPKMVKSSKNTFRQIDSAKEGARHTALAGNLPAEDVVAGGLHTAPAGNLSRSSDGPAEHNIYKAQEEASGPAPKGRGLSASGSGGHSNAPDIQLQTFTDTIMASSISQEETKKDSFLSRVFTFASDLENEFGEKIYFNSEGLTQIERKLRLTFGAAKNKPQEKLDTVRDCSAFLCYVLQERFKGRLIKFQDFDPWGWPMIFERPSAKITSYPIERVWRLLWHDALPDPGWLIQYLCYLEETINAAPGSRTQGAAAARSKIMSHAEKIIEAQTEHKCVLIMTSSLGETSHIETDRTGLMKLEQILKNTFHPGIAPTTDGWKLLRCYGHLLAEIMAKDFKASWYNVEGNDGLWSMQTPWKTFIFPIGKIYKAASSGENLAEYYDTLADEKRRYTAQ